MELSLNPCNLCPRKCNRKRLTGEAGICGAAGGEILLARAALHFWEEPCISGKEGSGAVFFSGCNLRCIYCQNRDISNLTVGKAVTVARLSDIFLELQEQGANNLNLVTPTHYALQIQEALQRAKENGLHVPVVYNTSGYEDPEILRMLENEIDVYLTDFKYSDPALAKAFSSAPDYPEVAKAALAEMVREKPEPKFDARGMMTEGVIVRHLLLPGHVRNAEDTVQYVYETYGQAVYLSLMNQYTPLREFPEYPELSRRVTKREYNRLLQFAMDIGVENAFVQEGKTQSESFIPAFDYEGVEKR